MNERIGGPNMIRLPDGRILAGDATLERRHTNLRSRGSIPEKATLTECLKLPSGGDTSYPGLVWKDDMLWISYYSSHEEKTCIYLAKVRFE
jgi:hypothetical protein